MLRYHAALCAIFMLAANVAIADDAPVSAGTFLSLAAPRRAPDGKIAAPWRNTPPYFFPLARQKIFMKLPRRARVAAAMPELIHHPLSPAPSSLPASGMTHEQANQILSLFSSAR
ncbi:MAG: hypothetical protein KGI29_03090 [Pseudomonadota bacterium]|nr:hypothetical protein [Pseudomonadota bacterium]MDE3038445.1 hypothetical protein [Pseudomonadota bacterium]